MCHKQPVYKIQNPWIIRITLILYDVMPTEMCNHGETNQMIVRRNLNSHILWHCGWSYSSQVYGRDNPKKLICYGWHNVLLVHCNVCYNAFDSSIWLTEVRNCFSCRNLWLKQQMFLGYGRHSWSWCQLDFNCHNFKCIFGLMRLYNKLNLILLQKTLLVPIIVD